MGPFTGISIYLILWWVVFLTVLPLGSQSYHEAGVKPPAGADPGAPMDPQMWKKAKLTTLISAGIFAVFLAAVLLNLIPLPDVAKIY